MKKSVHRSTLVLKIMKIAVLQVMVGLIFTGVSLAWDSNAQDILNKPISLKAEDARLRTVLSTLEQQYKVQFVYSSKAIQADRKISINARGQRLAEFLDTMLGPLHIAYRVVQGQIILTPTASTSEDADLKNSNQAAVSLPLDRQVTGRVVDENSNGLPGVSVVLKGTQRGTTTNSDGRYELTIPEVGSPVLVFSFVGYMSQEVAVGAQSQVNVSLK
ncbi:MAG: carboxypeptidase-like regulatory domain-containing protein, partial [Bacteroidetes bacterium]|nr:carboxypeptidase-like regulatory domain-containing protein [Bacteroidota bacterium]